MNLGPWMDGWWFMGQALAVAIAPAALILARGVLGWKLTGSWRRVIAANRPIIGLWRPLVLARRLSPSSPPSRPTGIPPSRRTEHGSGRGSRSDLTGQPRFCGRGRRAACPHTPGKRARWVYAHRVPPAADRPAFRLTFETGATGVDPAVWRAAIAESARSLLEISRETSARIIDREILGHTDEYVQEKIRLASPAGSRRHHHTSLGPAFGLRAEDTCTCRHRGAR